MIILGIDPGYAIVGYGLVENNSGKCRALEYGVITTPKTDSLPSRLLQISQNLVAIIDKYSPDAIAIEELFFQNNQKTAIFVAEARGAIMLTAFKKCPNLFEYTPLQIKQAMTGYGRAEKRQVQEMVKSMLNLKAIPKPDDAADALAVALTHAQTNRLACLFEI